MTSSPEKPHCGQIDSVQCKERVRTSKTARITIKFSRKAWMNTEHFYPISKSIAPRGYLYQDMAVLLIGDSHVREIKSPHFQTKCMSGAGLKDVLSYLRENKLINFELIVVSVGINDLPELIGFHSPDKNKLIFLQIQKQIQTIMSMAKTKIVFATIPPKDLKKVAIRYPRKCNLHYSHTTNHTYWIRNHTTRTYDQTRPSTRHTAFYDLPELIGFHSPDENDQK